VGLDLDISTLYSLEIGSATGTRVFNFRPFEYALEAEVVSTDYFSFFSLDM